MALNENTRYLAVKADATDVTTTAITAATGLTDISEVESVTINETLDSERLQQQAGDWRGEIVATGGSGIIELVSKEPAHWAFFRGVRATASRRFLFVYQRDRSALSGDPKTPAASAANPQWAGHAVISGIDWHGTGGSSPRLMRVTAELDKDAEERVA